MYDLLCLEGCVGIFASEHGVGAGGSGSTTHPATHL